MCYSALCSPPGVATGIIIREKGEGEEVGFRSSHPLELGNGATLVGSNYIDNRKLSGCKSKTTARNGFQKAHLQQSGPSPDEWPPASSTSGGIYPDGYGVVVQMISTHSNTRTYTTSTWYPFFLGRKPNLQQIRAASFRTVTSTAI